MGLRIIYGRAGTGKSEYIFNEIKEKIKNNYNKKIYIITPEQFSFTAEKKLMQDMKSVIKAEVITFNRMAYRLMQEKGGIINTSLTKCGKAMLIYSILQAEKNNLKFLNKSDENIDLAMRTITEFKKHGILVNDLIKESENIDDVVLKTKLNDLIIIYKRFNEKIKDDYIDETDLLTNLAENIDKIDLFKGAEFYIDEFSGFTEQEYTIIENLINISEKVTVNFCIDNLDLKTDPNIDVFYPNKITLSKILKLNGNEKIEFINLENTYRFKNEELKILEKSLYNKKICKCENNIENVKLFLAKNQYSEIENVAKEIKRLIKYENYRYKDISVITKSINSYSGLIRAIFNKYNIPVFIDEKRDLNQNIVIQYFLSIFEILIKNFTYESVFNYLKIGFLDIEENDIFKLEKYCIKYGIKNNKFKSDFVYGINGQNKEEIGYLNKLRKEITNPLIELKENINKNRTVENIAKEMYLFLKNNNFEIKLNEKICNLKNKELIDLAKEYKESYAIILNILDEMVLIFKDEKMTLDKFYNLVKIGLKNNGLGKIPSTQDQVIVGDTDRSRSHKVKAIFIIGLNDGIFPSIDKNEGFLSDNDRELLKIDGIELAKGTLENLYDDNFNIYKAFTTAEEKLFLSYASSDNEGKNLRPSILIMKLKKIFTNINEESDILLADNEYGNEKNLLSLKNRISVLNTQKLYGSILKTSVSKLEKYKTCPYSYFLQYILNLKEKEELKVQNIDTGSFMHEVIDTFFEKIQIEKKSLSDISENDIEKIIDEIINELLNDNKNYIFNATAKYRLLVIRLKRIILKAIKYIIDSLVKSEFNLLGTEIEFSENGKYRPIIINTDDGKKVEIVGKIDRVDVGRLDDKQYVRIIDYKSSVKGIDLNSVYGGLQLQLITYMDAICTLEDFLPASILYFSLLEQIINSNKKLSEEEIESKIKNNFKMKGLVLADIKVAKMHDKNLETGASSIVPIYIDKSGNLSNKKSSIVTKEEFEKLQKYIIKTIKEISKEIFEGNMEVKPYYKNKKTPCEYCSYKLMCGFNSGIYKNDYRYIPEFTKDEVLNKM